MADEHTLLIETHIPIPYTCATGVTIEKGAMCMMGDVMTAATSTGDTDIVAGVAQSEKLAADTGANTISIYRGGVFRATAGVAGVTFGKALITDTATSSANRLVDADVDSENIVGTCLETAASGDTFVYELKPIVVNLA